MVRRTKTFVEHRWYRRSAAGLFVEVPTAETGNGTPIDDQVTLWVNETDAIIIHPGQIGMHTTWHGSKRDPFQLKCLTIGLTVLYQEKSHGGQPDTEHAAAAVDTDGFDPGAAPV